MTRGRRRTASGPAIVVPLAGVLLLFGPGPAAGGVGGHELTAARVSGPARTDVPVEPSREEARGQAARELADREYADARPGVVERALRWVVDRLSRVSVSDDPFSSGLLVVVLGVLLALFTWAIHRTGGFRRRTRLREQEVFERDGLTAADHRAAADRHAAAGEWELAVLERFRAVVRTLEGQAVISAQPGRTADEVARDAGAWLPGLAADLTAQARVFDDVCYGGRRVGETVHDGVRDLDERLRRTRTADAATGPAGPVLTVPS